MTQSINELKSYTEYNVSTPTSVFTIGFQYKYNVDQVNVYVDGVEATAAGYTVQHDSHGTISLTPAVPAGVVRLARETDIDTSAHTFSAVAKFTAGNMDENFKQIRHAQQEVRDVVIRTASEFSTLDANATAALQAATTAVNTANSIDAKATQAQLDASTALSTLSTQKGAANGIATLDANTVVPVEQLPTASTTGAGLIQVATQQEVALSSSTVKAVTPRSLIVGVKTHLNADGAAPMFACRAWVNFSGTGTVAIQASGNVHSITDNGVGDYTVNFITAMPDAKYAVGVTGISSSTTDTTRVAAVAGSESAGAALKTTTQCRVNYGLANSIGMRDSAEMNVSIFR